MPILIDMERSSEASDLKTNNIQIPLIQGITEGKERRSESCHSGSILVVLISTSVVVLGSVGFGFSVSILNPSMPFHKGFLFYNEVEFNGMERCP